MNQRPQRYKYIFSYILLGLALAILLLVPTARQDAFGVFGRRLILVGFLMVSLFLLFQQYFYKANNSYRQILMEGPLFHGKAKAKTLEVNNLPLFPRFLALYLDHDGEDPSTATVHSIQAVRYESGYLSDRLFLPIKRPGEKDRGFLLDPEKANRLLKTYAGDFPLVVHEKDFARTWLNQEAHSIVLNQAVDTEDLARRLYPKLSEVTAEALHDFYNFEVNNEDPVYGAKIACAVYLDYLNAKGYYTTPTSWPFAKESNLAPVYPEEEQLKTIEENWAKEDPAETTVQDNNTYIGPFTPLDEDGRPIISQP